jgi:hypothetical protein
VVVHRKSSLKKKKPASSVLDKKWKRDECSRCVKDYWITKKKLKVEMKPPPSAKSGTIGPKKLTYVSHSKDVKKKLAKKSPAKTVPTPTFVNDEKDLG